MSAYFHRPLPNNLTWCPMNSSTITQCINFSQNPIQLKQIHCLLIKFPSKSLHLPPLFPKLLTRLLRFPSDNHFYARHLFDQIPNCTNHFTWNSLISYCLHHYHFGQSISLYARMHKAGIPESEFTFSSVLSASARIPVLYLGRQVHARVIQLGFLTNKIVLTSLMDMYAKCGFISDAKSLFVAIDDKDIVAWTSMIRGYSKLGMMDDAQELFDKMEERNSFSWTTMVAGYANCGNMKAAKLLYDAMIEKNPVSQLAMIAGYGRCGDVAEAERIFGGILVPDSSCCAAMVACYSQNGYAKEAIDMYKQMKEENLGTNEVAIVGAISACVQLGDVEMASKLIDQVDEGCCDRTLFVSNALIHKHSKFGNIEKAQEEFNRMKDRDVVTYSTLIIALADHGKAKEALDLFSKMEEEGIKPNQICFIGALNACAHAGLIEQGCKYFELMRKGFGIEPQKGHYACMVDLLGRAGEVEMAYNIIKGAREIDAKTWGSLLGACKIHGNLEVGEIAAKHLFEMEPENTGNYVLLANTYAQMKEWNEAEKVRKMMVERGIRKFPGYCWVSRSS
uniref:Pentatricopeptide repeat-containing protein At5g37570 n=2 Tax=Cucumis melo TaxID=3656 RepID=A0A9I9E9T9_CUCME